MIGLTFREFYGFPEENEKTNRTSFSSSRKVASAQSRLKFLPFFILPQKLPAATRIRTPLKIHYINFWLNLLRFSSFLMRERVRWRPGGPFPPGVLGRLLRRWKRGSPDDKEKEKRRVIKFGPPIPLSRINLGEEVVNALGKTFWQTSARFPLFYRSAWDFFKAIYAIVYD